MLADATESTASHMASSSSSPTALERAGITIKLDPLPPFEPLDRLDEALQTLYDLYLPSLRTKSLDYVSGLRTLSRCHLMHLRFPVGPVNVTDDDYDDPTSDSILVKYPYLRHQLVDRALGAYILSRPLRLTKKLKVLKKWTDERKASFERAITEAETHWLRLGQLFPLERHLSMWESQALEKILETFRNVTRRHGLE